MTTFFQHGWVAGIAVAAVALAASPSPVITSAGPVYSLKLKSFALPAAAPIGLLIVARVNDGPPLRLLLDSGARFLVLDRKTAARSGCAGGAAIDLVGVGGAGPREATQMKAGRVEVGGLTVRDIEVAIVEKRVFEGIDGVFPLAALADYLIRLDLPAHRLDLLPYPVSSASGTPALSSNGLLFIKGTLNGLHEGYFLLDTGAAYNAISTSLARRVSQVSPLAATLGVSNGSDQISAPMIPETLRFRVGLHELPSDPVLAVDLSTASRYLRLEVSGLLGYPALRNSVVTVNYRDSLVQIDRK